MLSFIKKLTGSKENLPAAAAADGGSAKTASGDRSAAQDTLASLGLDPSLLADDMEDDGDPALESDPKLLAELDAVKSAPAVAPKKPAPPKPAAPAAASSGEVDLDAIHRDLLGDEEDIGDVEIHAHEEAELEAQLAALVGIEIDVLNELAALEDGEGEAKAS
ncbi:hypothetical protein H9P43_001587 [Blastocladiella emersonii ATCC 22665]|nr:hypothetical protein H9P43_001587 [Blastocladiella emersonii ATCC 22665]